MYSPFSQERLLLNIKKFRNKLDMTQSDLGKLIGVNQSKISEYEKGRLQVPVELLGDLLNALQCSFEELWGHPTEGIDAKTRGFLSEQGARRIKDLFMLTLDSISNDPSVLMRLELNSRRDVQSADILHLYYESFKPMYRTGFFCELLRYLSAIKGRGAKANSLESDFLFKLVLQYSKVPVADKKLRDISQTPIGYQGKGTFLTSLPTDSMRRILFWLAVLMSQTTAPFESDIQYINNIGSRLGLSKSFCTYIWNSFKPHVIAD